MSYKEWAKAIRNDVLFYVSLRSLRGTQTCFRDIMNEFSVPLEVLTYVLHYLVKKNEFIVIKPHDLVITEVGKLSRPYRLALNAFTSLNL